MHASYILTAKYLKLCSWEDMAMYVLLQIVSIIGCDLNIVFIQMLRSLGLLFGLAEPNRQLIRSRTQGCTHTYRHSARADNEANKRTQHRR